ncbi:unnamed protein product [Anisakis simplex]|uniref:OAR domain-containing protein n=1 Tax=Anisakis simplex TaxID=6269 RepID=A0A0M3JZE8_ANISI|nr:unnamed protein product [Anisakis simplex]
MYSAAGEFNCSATHDKSNNNSSNKELSAEQEQPLNYSRAKHLFSTGNKDDETPLENALRSGSLMRNNALTLSYPTPSIFIPPPNLMPSSYMSSLAAVAMSAAMNAAAVNNRHITTNP